MFLVVTICLNNTPGRFSIYNVGKPTTTVFLYLNYEGIASSIVCKWLKCIYFKIRFKNNIELLNTN